MSSPQDMLKAKKCQERSKFSWVLPRDLKKEIGQKKNVNFLAEGPQNQYSFTLKMKTLDSLTM